MKGLIITKSEYSCLHTFPLSVCRRLVTSPLLIIAIRLFVFSSSPSENRIFVLPNKTSVQREFIPRQASRKSAALFRSAEFSFLFFLPLQGCSGDNSEDFWSTPSVGVWLVVIAVLCFHCVSKISPTHRTFVYFFKEYKSNGKKKFS